MSACPSNVLLLVVMPQCCCLEIWAIPTMLSHCVACRDPRPSSLNKIFSCKEQRPIGDDMRNTEVLTNWCPNVVLSSFSAAGPDLNLGLD